MTISDAKNILGLYESDKITNDNINGLIELKKIILRLCSVPTRSKFDKEKDMIQLDAIDYILDELKRKDVL